MAIFRVAQEALTNVRKHAPRGNVEVLLRYAENAAHLVVLNRVSPGIGSASGLPGGGFGLTGMKERAELLGGSLNAGPTPDGFRVELTVPADGPPTS